MTRNNKDGTERRNYFASLYDAAALADSERIDSAERNLNQYLGSCEIDGSEERAGTVRNITYEIIESEVDASVPIAKVDAESYSERQERCARSVERLCAAIRNKLPFEAMNDADERYTYIYGGSVWYVEWDSEDESTATGGIRVHLIQPTDFVPQPGIPDIRDMEYCFLRFTTTKGELVKRYGVSEEALSLADCEYEYGADVLSDTVRVITAFYRGEDGEIGKFVFSGELTLADIPAYYRRRETVCEMCGGKIENCRCEEPRWAERTVDREELDAIFGAGAEGCMSVPYYLPKSFPLVIRKNTSALPSLFGSSDCEIIRPEQQAINKIESRILQKLLRAGVTPVMPEGTSISLSNAVFGQVIKTRPGESLESFGKIDTTPDISQDIEEADRLYEHARRILGISDAIQGTDDLQSESGYARQLRIARASVRLEAKRRMKYLAYSELYRLIFEHYLAFADRPRMLSYKDPFGRVHTAQFNRYDFIEECDGEYRYDDAYLFSVDENGGAGYTREALWERNLENLKSGTLGNKEDPRALLRYWQSQERAHYPYARENVEYFKDICEKGETK